MNRWRSTSRRASCPASGMPVTAAASSAEKRPRAAVPSIGAGAPPPGAPGPPRRGSRTAPRSARRRRRRRARTAPRDAAPPASPRSAGGARPAPPGRGPAPTEARRADGLLLGEGQRPLADLHVRPRAGAPAARAAACAPRSPGGPSRAAARSAASRRPWRPAAGRARRRARRRGPRTPSRAARCSGRRPRRRPTPPGPGARRSPGSPPRCRQRRAPRGSGRRGSCRRTSTRPTAAAPPRSPGRAGWSCRTRLRPPRPPGALEPRRTASASRGLATQPGGSRGGSRRVLRTRVATISTVLSGWVMARNTRRRWAGAPRAQRRGRPCPSAPSPSGRRTAPAGCLRRARSSGAAAGRACSQT